jgi:hypothetical protein
LLVAWAVRSPTTISALKGRRHLSSCKDFNWQRPETERIATLSQQLTDASNGKWGSRQIFLANRNAPTMLRPSGGMVRDLTPKLNNNLYLL